MQINTLLMEGNLIVTFHGTSLSNEILQNFIVYIRLYALHLLESFIYM